MSEDIRFSVTVPAYKAQYLGECIDSILAQTYKNFEVIIVNDHSPQDLDSIVEKYDDPRIRYYKNEVGFGAEHVVGNWDKCLEYAQGEYLICMGDDDKLLPTCLENYVVLINKYPTLDVYHARTEIIDENSNLMDLQEVRPEFESAYSILFHRLKNIRIQYIGDFLFRTSALRAMDGFYDLPYACCSDDISVLSCASKGIANTYKPGFQYRSNRYTISRTQNCKKAIESYERACDWYKSFLGKGKAEGVDELYQELTLEEVLPKYLRGKIKTHIFMDLASHGMGTFCYWLRHGREHGISSAMVMDLFLSAMSRKLKNIIKNK